MSTKTSAPKACSMASLRSGRARHAQRRRLTGRCSRRAAPGARPNRSRVPARLAAERQDVSRIRNTRNARLTKMSTDDLLVEALRLSREERARIAAELLSSLEEMDDEVVAAWADELRRRSADVRDGRVSAVPWTTAREE